MQTFYLWNYVIQITEKADFDQGRWLYPDLPPSFACKQIHSNVIHEWYSGWDNVTEGDGLYTNQQNITLRVGVCDCIPIVIMGKEWFGLVHAGWKGLQQGILQSMIHKLQEKWESELVFFLGPSIRRCCYEVGKEFESRCSAEYLIPKGNGKYYFDMFGMIQQILSQFPCKEIVVHPECTHCGDHFFSYRKKDGVNNFVLIRKW